MFEKPTLKNLTSLEYGKPKKSQNEFLQTLGKPHVDSFNYLLGSGLKQLAHNILPEVFEWNKSLISLDITEVAILPPTVPSNVLGAKSSAVWPSECRQRGCSYSGRVIVKFQYTIDGVSNFIEKDLGGVPIMLKSKACHLSTLKPEQLVEQGEHEDEWGGYFVVKGNEKLVRMLLMTRRNYPVSLKRSSWKHRGDLFSDLGVLIRCVNQDHTAVNNVLHYVNDGSVRLMISYRRNLYYIPLILLVKCLVDYSDEAIYKAFMDGYDDPHMKGCLFHMLRSLHLENTHTSGDAKHYVGSLFKSKMQYDLPPNSTAEDTCDFILKNCLFIHLGSNTDKFNLLIMMTQKLFSLVNGKACIEGVDSVMMQELLLGGHLYLQVLKEKLKNWLINVKFIMLKMDTKSSSIIKLEDMKAIIKKSGNIEGPFENFLSTGNVSSKSGLGLMQDKGLVIIAENINRMRYMSHFRAVHRGSFFKDMRTTEARQLLPDAWGFICPVHTPDGTPCGLLNHLTKHCEVTVDPDEQMMDNLPTLLSSLGMQPQSAVPLTPIKNCYLTMLDGRTVGHVPDLIVGRLVDKLRILKIKGKKVPKTLEIVLVPKKDICSQFPGLFIFSGPARMMRPVLNLAANEIEFIGTFEQIYLDICVVPEEAHEGMGKQTMGTPCHNWKFQSESKLYWLQTPATPLFRPVHYDYINLDDFPMGTNAIVAVISYTGYDMEDAMIINKSSLERGFAYGTVVKSEFVDLKSTSSYFGLDAGKPSLLEYLGEDGLPFPGTRIVKGQPYYCYFNYGDSKYVVGIYQNAEEAIIDNVKLCGCFPNARDGITARACITFRIPRKPSVGDKFASRAGQKGICSQAWPAEDLPFTESGIVPDIVFNPHGFPSRMTIAMMIECMAGKSGAVHGLVHDASPFIFSEENTAIDYFGKLLQAGGYNYYGTEKMYSGVTGGEMTASIFFGVVHYQRLRHMVSDKWQVRSTGPIDVLTRQPVKGRKRGGGVRFGEMERDSLISHGASYLLQDRLFHCCDKSAALICRGCGTIVGPFFTEHHRSEELLMSKYLTCKLCNNECKIEKIDIPYILRYLIVQLASMNIKLKLTLEDT